MTRKKMKMGPLFLLIASLILFTPGLLAQATIDTVAGGGPDGIPALHANLVFPSAVTVDAGGTLYLTAWHRVFRVDASGVIHAFAGVGGDRGYSGDGLPGLNGGLYYPGGIAFDDNGNLFIADSYNSRIRRVDAVSGIITTFAGGGSNNPGNGGPATDASLTITVGIVADAAGNIYFSDAFNHRVRKVDVATGIITTVAGTGICGFSGNGGPATSANLCEPTHLALDRTSGFLYLTEHESGAVRKVDLGTGIISVAAGVGGAGLALDAAADFLYISTPGGSVYRHHINTATTTLLATGFELDLEPTGGGLALDGAGGLFVASPGQNKVFRINLSNNQVAAVAGNGSDLNGEDGFLARQTWLAFPASVVTDGSENLYVAENGIRRIDAVTGLVSTLQAIPVGGGAPAPAPAGTLFGSPDDNLYIGTDGSQVLRRDGITGALSVVAGTGDYDFSGDGGPATAAALTFASGGVRDGAGNIFFADYENYRIRRVDSLTGFITTVAGNGDFHYSGDGGPATSAGMNPYDVGLDGAGNLYFSDANNHRIRKVDPATGIVSTIAGTGVMGTGGDGGPATAAQLRSPGAIAVDAAGSITITENSDRIRRVDAASGIIDTIAGSGIGGFYGDGGPALDARFDFPADVHYDGAGNLLVADNFNFRIRKVTFPENAAPVARAGADIQAECASSEGALVTLDGSASTDPDSIAPGSDIDSFEWFENYGGTNQVLIGTGETIQVTLSVGTHLITLRVTDTAGLTDTDEVEVSVEEDTTSPALLVTMTPEFLSPPNHQFRPVHASVSATDTCGPVSVVLLKVTSSDSDLPGGVVPSSDIRNADFGTADFDFDLRSERQGGSDRIYTIIYRAVDSAGHETLSSDTVIVRPNARPSRGPSLGGGSQPKRPRPVVQ